MSKRVIPLLQVAKLSRLAHRLRELQESVSHVEEAMYHPTDSAPGLEFGGLETQSIDDLIGLVAAADALEWHARSMLDALAADLERRGLRLAVHDNEMAEHVVVHPDGSEVLSTQLRNCAAVSAQREFDAGDEP
jgi:hypothetical protein